MSALFRCVLGQRRAEGQAQDTGPQFTLMIDGSIRREEHLACCAREGCVRHPKVNSPCLPGTGPPNR
jgi:hypothetical protein